MDTDLQIAAHTDKASRYTALLPQIKSLLAGENSWVANLANCAAALHQTFGFWWVGFYRVSGDELVLGPFQGPIACTRIAYGKGVCGKAWEQKKTMLVPDVDAFPGHIACSAESKSEIVVPIFDSEGHVAFVLDVDSATLNDFDEVDQANLEQLCQFISEYLPSWK